MCIQIQEDQKLHYILFYFFKWKLNNRQLKVCSVTVWELRIFFLNQTYMSGGFTHHQHHKRLQMWIDD